MTATAGSAFAHDPPANDVYDPDDVVPQNSPFMKPYVPKLKPSPSPPAVPLPQVSTSLSEGRKSSSNRRRKIRPSQGDAILIYHLDDGKRPEIAALAGSQPLAHSSNSDGGEQSGTETDESLVESGDDEEEVRSQEMSPLPTARPGKPGTEPSGPGSIDLRFLASNALAAAANAASKATGLEGPSSPSHDARSPQRFLSLESVSLNDATNEISMREAHRPVLAPPISPYSTQSSQEQYSPRQNPPSQLMHPSHVMSPTSLAIPSSGNGELPPIQAASPKSEAASQEALPSIRSQLLEQLTGPPKDLVLRHGPQLPHSPPSGPPRMMMMSGNHSSPPVSPNDIYRQAMPSPAQTVPGMSPYYYSGASSVSLHRSGMDYSSASNSETPNTDMLTPATSITERMSIDNMTHPIIGAFTCKFHGCNAAPFQTQYLLNSHANVHSSARPHYCSVKGCPRSEGGKGFKRKNEMIRHGLVHDSPGYVCPFCPDREHRYPRPDNLQRHVRVHHVDKDKDDPMLRDVLSQRPDGPNRGRRRRGGP